MCAKILVQMQLGLSDAIGTTGNVSTVKYYTVPATELDCTRKEPAFKTSIFPNLLQFWSRLESIFTECVF